MKQLYKPIRFRADTLRLIDTLNDIVEDYLAQGYVLTVRQLYYQMVARGHIENTERSYKHITGVVNDADEGALAVMIGHENGKVVMQFASPTAWIGFTPEQAMDIAQTLITHARKAGIVGVYTLQL